MQWIESISDWLYRARRRMATGGMVALVCLLGYHVVFGANGALVYYHKRAENQRLEKEIQEMQQANARLEQQIKALKSDPKAIEKEAREQLKYARPGEVVYTNPPDKKAQRSAAEAQNKPAPAKK